jgi:glycosyltransferase involved in cell wall biosynthesis
MRICAITNVYNESFNLPIWLNYYGRQVGIENCIVIDHGSDDGSTEDLHGASRIRIPRVPFDDNTRADVISSIANSMLRFYDAVLYADSDEIIVADPGRYANLVEFCQSMPGPVATTKGLNVLHRIDLEAPIVSARPILGQRSYVQFVSPMCKTAIVKKPISWGGGFHSSNHPPSFSSLYMFHLRWADLGECLKRLSITRNVTFSDPRMGTHQRLNYPDYVNIFQRYASMNIKEDDFEFNDEVERFSADAKLEENGKYRCRTHIASDSLIRIPERFGLAF